MEAGRITFAKLCHEELLREKERDGIGLYAEKRLHSVLKRWMYDDFSAHEQKVPQRDGKISRFVADILTPAGEIIEIQTGELYPLLRKIAFYMEKTDLTVTLVHPLTAQKYVSWMDPATGELVSRNKSPRHDTVLSGLALLKPFAPYLGNERFSVLFPLVELDEYRLLDGGGQSRKLRSHRYELIPLALLDAVRLRTKEDYLACLPTDLPQRFVAKAFGKLTRLRGYALYDAIAVFEALGAVERIGKEGRSTLFERKI
ncbi:MAG: hypothetical protein IJX39_02715 [Clostridia bacterium]|nr:hypothetical protein [Clostridia bacterium]